MAKDHLARLVLSLVREEIDLAAISGSYAGERRRPNKNPSRAIVGWGLSQGRFHHWAAGARSSGGRRLPDRRRRHALIGQLLQSHGGSRNIDVALGIRGDEMAADDVAISRAAALPAPPGAVR